MGQTIAATRIAHITDAHVAAAGRPTATLKHRSVEVLRDLVAQCLELEVDLVLFGGDNIDNRGAGEADLDAFLEIVRPLPTWVSVLGNHEAPRADGVSKERCSWALGGHGVAPGRLNFSTKVGPVRIVGIDTVLSGSSGGYVSPATMKFLADEIRRADEEHILVLGHHRCIGCGRRSISRAGTASIWWRIAKTWWRCWQRARRFRLISAAIIMRPASSGSVDGCGVRAFDTSSPRLLSRTRTSPGFSRSPTRACGSSRSSRASPACSRKGPRP
ncbi:MAG: hypothetical protein HC923_00975 [Myxococcales bacterium]|nr:hypothetical protein [Myxococcales bacterium]